MEHYVDLHVHSRYSDGMHTPAELVAMAVRKGLKAIALADHDAVGGIDEAMTAGEQLGMEIIPAVELSVEHKNFHDIHLLGYYIDHRDSAFQARLADFCRRRDTRGKAIVEKINTKLSWEKKGAISYEQILATAEGALGRPHIARALIAEGYASDTQDAFNRYLLPCNVPKLYFPMNEALSEIRRLGGLAVLAHPTSITDNRITLRAMVKELADLGLSGIEVYNNMCFADDMIFLEGLAREFGLLMTGGSDYHGFEDDVEMGSGRGGLIVAYRLVSAMKERLAESR